MTVHELAAQKTLPATANIDGLKDMLPDFAKDIRLNLGSVFKQDANAGLALNQIMGIALASAYATRHAAVIAAVEGEAAEIVSPAEKTAAQAAATIMAMNNIYYRATYMTGDEELGRMPAGLRMNVIGNPGIDKATFELYSLAVSAINGCGACVQSHAALVQKEGLSKGAVQQSFKIAAVLSAAAQALSI
ncbi:MAG: carboxymuconolactone decarboxylase family protein [Bdellovibrionales bacterium]|jgi:alkyl hydroperoxide reductase subunit D|nr:carboxymuconolactone decarboxylase family protein [Bdellovibrionales bacterium]